MGWHGRAGDDATLLESGSDSAFGANDRPGPRQADMSVQTSKRIQTEPLRNGAPFGLVGCKIKPLAVVNLVKAKLVREAIDH